MKKFFIVLCNIACLLMIFDAINAWHMLAMFLFAGIIPGTNESLSPTQMITLVSIMMTIILVITIVLPIAKKIKFSNKKHRRQIRTRQLKNA